MSNTLEPFDHLQCLVEPPDIGFLKVDGEEGDKREVGIFFARGDVRIGSPVVLWIWTSHRNMIRVLTIG